MGGSEWDELAAEVRRRRNCGRVHVTRLSVPGQLSARAAADEAARSLGLNALASRWVEVDATVATRIASRILACDLAYDLEVMPRGDAQRMAQALASHAGVGASFLTNATWAVDGCDVRLTSWDPISEATFDSGIVCVGPDALVMIWVEDED